MGLFKEKFCVECGKKAGYWTSELFDDGSRLCKECKAKVPFYIDTYKHYRTYEEYKKLKEYIQYSNEVLRPKFHETARYKEYVLDEVNRLFYIGSYLRPSEALILELSNVDMFSLEFIDRLLSEKIIGGKVTGDIITRVVMNCPHFSYEKTYRGVSVKAKTDFERKVYTYEPPKGMREFSDRFLAILYQIKEENEPTENKTVVEASEIEKAKALFMIDDLSGMSIEDIKAQRNRMIKMFHPDAGNEADNKYAQKINNAYEVLVSVITK